jgi:ACS family hexuronate transporter-like MFS transporter
VTPTEPTSPDTAASRNESSNPLPAGRVGHYRWVICALIFFATTINYIDRQVLGILAPDLQRIIGWNEKEYGFIVTAFQAAYAASLLLTGWLIDRIGTRVGYSLSIIFWSIAAMGHALARSALGFGVWRGLLGFGEGGNFPTAIKTIAEWFPKKERAFATGLFNSGTNVGAIVAPLIVPWIAINWGWQWAFILTGALGFFWLLLWLPLYRRPEEHPRLSPQELAYIRSDPPEPSVKIPWIRLLPHRQTWAFVLGKFMTDPIWWFYLFWLPKFLHTNYGLTLDRMGPPLVVIYLVSDAGSIAGGWLSSFLIRRGWSINAARKTTMLICAFCVVPIMFAWKAADMWVAVGFIGLATAAHQAWSANIFTIASDMFPRQAVGSVVGLGGMGGAVGGMYMATAAGLLLHWTGSYHALFVVAGSAYLAALLVVHSLAPRLKPVDL